MFKNIRGVVSYVTRSLRPVLPSSVNFEVNSNCNLDCVMCARSQYREGRTIWDLEKFKGVLDQIEPTHIAIHGYSEPLLNKNLPQLISYAEKNNSKTTITSNLILLKSEEQALEIVDSGLKLLKISVDGNTEDVYAKVRGVKKLAIVKSNIKLIEDAKKKRNSKFPLVRLSYTVTHYNFHEIEEFIKYVNEKTEQNVIYFQMLLFSETLLKEHDWPVVKKDDFYRSIVTAKNTADKLRIKTNLERVLKYFDIYWSAYAVGEKLKTNRICIKPWLSTFIASNGDVMPCDLLGLGGPVMGNVNKQSFDEIWHSKEYQDFREKIKNGEKPTDICAECFPDNISDLLYYSRFSKEYHS